ncbi:hypothetical protein YPPY13_4614, partial [Yersinia pestis PY-13]
MADLPVLAGGG